jgi:hypothetical protein
MFRSLLVLALASLVVGQDIQAQQDPTGLTVGRRIRVHQPGQKKVTGTFAFMDAERLALVTAPGDTVQLSRKAITRVDLADGTKSKAGKGAVDGLLIGGGVGIALGIAFGVAAEDTYADAGVPAYAAGTGILFAAIGAGVGALIGSGSRTDRWVPTAWPTVSFQPAGLDGKRLALGMNLTF